MNRTARTWAALATATLLAGGLLAACEPNPGPTSPPPPTPSPEPDREPAPPVQPQAQLLDRAPHQTQQQVEL